MHIPNLVTSVLVLSALSATPAFAQSPCEPDGSLEYLCGLGTVEDMVAISGTRWILAGQVGAVRGKAAGFYLIDAKARTIAEVMPDFSGAPESPFNDCPGRPDAVRFMAHGISVRQSQAGPHELYVVNHAGREAVEVFDVELGHSKPRIRWKGCVIAPRSLSANGVAHLPRGGFAVTSFGIRGDPTSFDKIVLGQAAGAVFTWHHGAGWVELPGTSFPGDNGIAASNDGRTLYVASWGDATLRIVDVAAVSSRSISLGSLHPDNVHLAANGDLLVAGQIADPKVILTCARSTESVCGLPFRVVAVDPKSSSVRTLFDGPGNGRFGGASVAAIAEGRLWIGTFKGNRVAFTVLK